MRQVCSLSIAVISCALHLGPSFCLSYFDSCGCMSLACIVDCRSVPVSCSIARVSKRYAAAFESWNHSDCSLDQAICMHWFEVANAFLHCDCKAPLHEVQPSLQVLGQLATILSSLLGSCYTQSTSQGHQVNRLQPFILIYVASVCAATV